ncbi:MAG: hypothetical protein JWN69_611 [Alphaproteobacteria bacterium]|jgi:AcrR family transcriptional regulator|nr:hypothetical protein [Alphaproteobacteria bacterium]
MPRSKAKVTEGRERRGGQFIAVAARRMAELGYEGTTVRDIAKEMGLTSATLFHYFPSKNDLLEAIIQVGVEHGLGVIRNAMGADFTPLARVQRLVRAHLGIVYGEMGHIHHVWTSEWSKLSVEARERLRTRNEEYRGIWRETLRRLNEAGLLRSDAEVLRHLLLPGLNWTSTWAHSLDGEQMDALADQICSVVLNCSVAEFRRLHGKEATKERQDGSIG